MASAVAVEASLNAPRLPNNLSDDEREITAKVGPIDSEDEGTPRDTVEENGLDDGDDDDLFGDGPDDDDEQPALRTLDDEELDSGDDEGRQDRAIETQQDADETEEKTFNFMDADIARHAIPEPSDGELYLLKIPRFLAIEPTAWNYKTFEAPTKEHHNKGQASEHFSAYNTAMTTVRWRRSPTNPSELQSNARILRWEDGSLTLQFASEPLTQYEIGSQMLAPPQIDPKKPTPTAISSKLKKPPQYKESYTYLVAPYEEAQVMRVTNKFTTGLSITPAASSNDAALDKLQADLEAAAKRGRGEREEAISFIDVKEDPELQRAREEAQFKEKQRAIKAREKNEQRERERASRTLGRTGARSSGYGLNIGDLEGEESGRRGGGARKSKPKTGLHRGLSDDEDYGIRGKTREDEYDEDDDFIAGSDEEPEFVEDDDDEEEILDSPPRRGRETQSPKRNRGGAAEDDDDDEEVVVSRTKRRRVVEEDDEDE